MNKIPGIKIIIALPILFLGFLFLLGRPWDNPTMKEIYLENYQTKKVGIVKKTELWKGCGLYIEFENPDRKYISFKKDTASFSIGSDCEINEQIHRKDFFQKLPKSNKCFIIRKDSIMLFDCDTDLDFIIEKYKIPISKINGWNLNRNYKWFKMPYQPIEKYLNKEYYEKYKTDN
ncbi:hypothetical protein GCM10007962_32610 [Yeosuana aromativorans]|uniref:Uncharacterized protein n=1 Tax=Yeosuana aromativorans TaxID=288019 RepID=A0A8J3BP93_9FLAO|nr:hypothetical protein [Yeosuana aromativorans]GGK35730.1 hypothetical protein GCM10007962_32610 [Yeosuana aromativorans]